MITPGTAQSRNENRLEVEAVRQENEVEKTETPSSTGAMSAVNIDREDAQSLEESNWDNDPYNPYNWPNKKKLRQLLMLSTAAFTASVGTSLPSSARFQFQDEFGVTTTQSILPLSIYVFALGLGPVVGGPLSETVGRYPVYLVSTPLGALFTLGAGFAHNFVTLCFMRFLAGFCFSPSLAIASGTINDTYRPAQRAIPSTIFILMPFLGPGLGPVIGSFVVVRKGWRWTQWTLIFFAIVAIAASLIAGETYHTKLKCRRAKQFGLPIPKRQPLKTRIGMFLTVALIRPLHMMVTEPIVGLNCLYVACEFATLFTFFTAIPFIFTSVYGFSTEQQGLVFISIVVGCILGAITVLLCNVVLYLPRAKRYPPHEVPPKYRLYPAMIGSIGLPLGLFWLAWTAKSDVSWVSPTMAIVAFAWGNLCVFVGTIQYISDVYNGSAVASAASANSLARYGLAGAFPLFTTQLYTRLGIAWATSLLGFVAVALMPVPWALFRWGKALSARSKYKTTAMKSDQSQD